MFLDCGQAAISSETCSGCSQWVPHVSRSGQYSATQTLWDWATLDYEGMAFLFSTKMLLVASSPPLLLLFICSFFSFSFFSCFLHCLVFHHPSFLLPVIIIIFFPHLQTMDGDMYDKMRTAYTLYAQIEVDSCSAIKAEFGDLRDQAQLVSLSLLVSLMYPFCLCALYM